VGVSMQKQHNNLIIIISHKKINKINMDIGFALIYSKFVLQK